MNLPTNMPTNNNNNDGGRRSRVSTGRSNRQQWNSSRQSNRSRVGEMNRMFENEFNKQQGRRPSRPPSIASSNGSRRSSNSPRRRQLTPRSSNNNNNDINGSTSNRPPIPNGPAPTTRKHWIYEPPASYFSTTYKDTYASRKLDKFRKSPENSNIDEFSFAPISKRQQALARAAKEHTKALVGRTRPAGFYYNKAEEDQDLRMQEELHEADDHFRELNISQTGSPNLNDTSLHLAMQREATARELQVKHFIKLNDRLHLNMDYYGPNYKGKSRDEIVRNLVESKNFEGRMNALRSKRRHVTLNSSREVQNCISPRDLKTGKLQGYGNGGWKRNDIWPEQKRAQRHDYLMKKSKKAASEKINHFTRNPVTGFMNTLIRNNMKPSHLWSGGH